LAGEEKDNLKELTLAITLLVGISTILFKIVDYSNKNVVNEHIFCIMYLLVLLLIFEIVIIVLFLLLKGYSIWPIKEERLGALKNLIGIFGPLMFFIPIFILIYTSLSVAFSISAEDWGLSSTFVVVLQLGIVIFSALATLHLGGVDLELLKIFEHMLDYDCRGAGVRRVDLELLKIFEHIPLKIKTLKKHSKQFWSLLFRFYIVLTYILISLVFIIVLVQTTTFLLCGSYTIEINHFPDDNTDIMSLTIKDTGTPSEGCYINLYRIHKLNESIFQVTDNITLNGSANISKYMIGEKKYGIYYLFINTSDLPPDNYFLRAEVTLLPESLNLLNSKKYDDALFHLPSKNKTENILNQTSVL